MCEKTLRSPLSWLILLSVLFIISRVGSSTRELSSQQKEQKNFHSTRCETHKVVGVSALLWHFKEDGRLREWR